MDHELPIASNLYSWFEQCGIISDVRSHLRQNLINALKNRDLELGRANTPKSAKQYVYDLLVAEYLLNHNYAYTLSVFASEAPLLVNFSSKGCATSKTDGKHNDKLQNDYVLHVLETLGIDPHNPRGQHIISQYKENDSPLILCVLKSLSMPVISVESSTEEKISPSAKYAQRTDSECLYSTDGQQLIAVKKQLMRRKKSFDEELKNKEVLLRKQAIAVDRQLVTLNESLRKVQGVMRAIALKERAFVGREGKRREEGVLEKQTELTTCKDVLLLDEKNRNLEQDLKRVQDDLLKVQEKLHSIDTPSAPLAPLSVAMKAAHPQTDPSANLAKNDAIEALRKENEQLNSIVREQRFRIEQITQRALQLSRQTNDTDLSRFVKCTETSALKSAVTAVISESSSTEDILQDAKLRLRKLEEESLKADQHYYNFIHTR